MNLSPGTLNCSQAILYKVLAVGKKPTQVRKEFWIRLETAFIKLFNRIQRNQTNQRAHAKFEAVTTRMAKNIVEETIILVPEFDILAAHLLHRCTNIDVVLKKLRGESLVCFVFLSELERD